MAVKNYIGILGGGQLGRMLCDAARNLGYQTMVLDPNPDGCARLSCDIYLAADYADRDSLQRMARECLLVTYEFENVPALVVEELQKLGANVPQGFAPLYLAQHRIREKEAVMRLGAPTADWRTVPDAGQLVSAWQELGGACILKTCCGGYDGKGQWRVNSEAAAHALAATLAHVPSRDFCGYILEKKIDFACEVSCLAVRSINGETVTFPVAENIHKDGILHLSVVPPRIDAALADKARALAVQIINGLDLVGPLAIEMFVGNDQVLYINETAPRPHNSMHYTLDGCDCSQFTVHIRALLGLKLENPRLLRPTVMLNLLGDELAAAQKKCASGALDAASESGIYLHAYGKTLAKSGRKMGHINFTATVSDTADAQAWAVAAHSLHDRAQTFYQSL